MSQLHRGQGWDFTWFIPKGKQKERKTKNKTKKPKKNSTDKARKPSMFCMCGFGKMERFRSRPVGLRLYVTRIRWGGAVKIRDTPAAANQSASLCFLPTFALSTLSLPSRFGRKSLADTRHGLLHRSQSEEVIKKGKGGTQERRLERERRTDERVDVAGVVAVGTVRNVNSEKAEEKGKSGGQSASNVF